ncbi:hypothetical protein OIU34_20735 [Pararhizobium sp. BT-229]|uniref:hypothetical protein n=1 Tax=Pararhizobium sp. BT-229 TaxID=2986923 RepID=UPI0021F6FBCF|nr:hypothetical protein [Pararhizobium sp. BT-229]MCV9964317.1 hypothetical protein [Pararhizobium sp. BT-229]
MKNHNFTLTFALPETTDIDDAIERLAENCSDSIVGIGVPGIVVLSFDREAENMEKAVTSAIEDVQKAVPGATLTEFLAP